MWSSNGHELFYRTPDRRIMPAIHTANVDSLVGDKPRLWPEKQFRTASNNQDFYLAPDGTRFAVLVEAEDAGKREAPTRVTILLNFFDELKRHVPVDGAAGE